MFWLNKFAEAEKEHQIAKALKVTEKNSYQVQEKTWKKWYSISRFHSCSLEATVFDQFVEAKTCTYNFAANMNILPTLHICKQQFVNTQVLTFAHSKYVKCIDWQWLPQSTTTLPLWCIQTQSEMTLCTSMSVEREITSMWVHTYMYFESIHLYALRRQCSTYKS